MHLKQVAYIKASNTEAGAHFGSGGSDTEYSGNALAISGDGNTLAVGAPSESSAAKGINGDQNDHSLFGAGAVYVFTRRGDDWAQQAYIKASNPKQSSRFGSTIALSADGNVMAVAAHWESSAAMGINGNQNDDSIPQAGAVYIFTRAGITWSQQTYIKASNTGQPDSGTGTTDGDQFGYSLALNADGTTLAVGAISEDSSAKGINGNQGDDSVPESGAAYVFTRSGRTWTQQAYIKASNTNRGDLFGYSMGISADGSTLAIAAYNEGSNSRQINGPEDNRLAPGSGAIYVFVRTAGIWKQTDYIKGSKSERNDALGYSLALSDDGNTIVAGAGEESCTTAGVNPPGCDNDSVNGSTSIGAAYVFFRSGGKWTEQAFIKASNPKWEDWFGVRSAISGDGNTIAISAPVQDGGAKGVNGNQEDFSATDSGAVYFFSRSGGTWSQRAFIKASNTHAYDEFGSSLALNRDGTFLVVGAHKESSGAKGVNGDQNDHSAPDSGAVYVFNNN
jgi:hypothetical protein